MALISLKKTPSHLCLSASLLVVHVTWSSSERFEGHWPNDAFHSSCVVAPYVSSACSSSVQLVVSIVLVSTPATMSLHLVDIGKVNWFHGLQLIHFDAPSNGLRAPHVAFITIDCWLDNGGRLSGPPLLIGHALCARAHLLTWLFYVEEALDDVANSLATWPHLLSRGSVFLASGFGVRMFETSIFSGTFKSLVVCWPYSDLQWSSCKTVSFIAFLVLHLVWDLFVASAAQNLISKF